MSMLVVKNVKKVYTTRFGGNKVTALQNVNLTVERGEFVAIMGESGSGKTTLMNIINSLDDPTEGEVFIEGTNLKDLSERDRENFCLQIFTVLLSKTTRHNNFFTLINKF